MTDDYVVIAQPLNLCFLRITIFNEYLNFKFSGLPICEFTIRQFFSTEYYLFYLVTETLFDEIDILNFV